METTYLVSAPTVAPSPSVPTVNSTLPCDFESTSICGYTNDQGHDNFDWSRNAGSTTSSGTGPFADHTLGTRAGELPSTCGSFCTDSL